MLELIGKTLLDRYRVEAYIASGGMANVYCGFDKLRNATVALKFMRPDFALDPHFENKFRTEAATLSKLAHPNIVRYYEIEREDKELFMVMDFIDGVSLQEHLFNNDHILAPAEVLTIVKPLATALRYAHSKGVIHRDIKPANIMLAKNKQILLTDFGIAKLVESATVTTVQAGTPAYMSPEQCASRELDHRSDQYSLAVLTYEMLAGRRPFIGESKGLPPGSVAESIRKEHLSVSPDPPSKYNQSLPTVLDQTLLRALSKRPQARYKTTTKLYDALEIALQGVKHAVRSVPPKNTNPNNTEPKKPIELAQEAVDVSAALPAQRKKGILWMLSALGLAVIALAFANSELGLLPNSGLSFTSNTATSVKIYPTSTKQPQQLSQISNSTCSPKHLKINGQDQPLLNPGESIKVPDLFFGTNVSVCDLSQNNRPYNCRESGVLQLRHGIYYINTGEGVFCSPDSTSTKQPTNTPIKQPTKRPPTATPYPQIKVDSNNLNMRKGPGEVYDVITSYPIGTTLRLHGKNTDVDPTKSGEWYRVSHSGRYGWVASWLTVHYKGATWNIGEYTVPRYNKVIFILINDYCRPQSLRIGLDSVDQETYRLGPVEPNSRKSFYINPGTYYMNACTETGPSCNRTTDRSTAKIGTYEFTISGPCN